MMTETLHKNSRELADLLERTPLPPSLVPDLIQIARDPGAARNLPGAELVLALTAPSLSDPGTIPLTTYTLYREFQRTGERRGYQGPYRDKRQLMAALALRALLGEDQYLDRLQDVIWNVCEETNWVIPAHENREIALNSVGTAFSLAEMIVALESKLADEVAARVRAEIERRIFEPYLARHEQLGWFRGHNNWNGVCNGGVGATFLLLERDTGRLAQALSHVLEGLDVFLSTAFEEEGSSSEGVSYWHYGLSNLIPFAEMLRLRTNGAIDILGQDRLREIATYPAKLMLSAGRYANFSDCEEAVEFNPAHVSRLVERTGVTSLYDTLAEGAGLVRSNDQSRFHNLWRVITWWDGRRPERIEIGDTWAQDIGVVKLTGQTRGGAPVVLAAKAGHNAENHNQNDVGSFILHVDGESLLCDPGRGLYSRDYFGSRRYENLFANSFGHSVPRVGGQLQVQGRAAAGKISLFDANRPDKQVWMDIGDAYDAQGLERIERKLGLWEPSGEFTCEDTFWVVGQALPVEEALVTWMEVSVSGSTARIVGERHELALTIEAPAGAEFRLAALEEESQANAKPVPLKRLSVDVVAQGETVVRVRGRVTRRAP